MKKFNIITTVPKIVLGGVSQEKEQRLDVREADIVEVNHGVLTGWSANTATVLDGVTTHITRTILWAYTAWLYVEKVSE